MAHFVRTLLAAGAVALTLAGPALATPDEDARAGFDAEQKGDFPNALRNYTNAAKGGVAYAMYNLGLMYKDGKGVQKNLPEALKWFTQAAEKGSRNGQNASAMAYERGEGTPKDLANAVKYYRMAADQGLLSAQNTLGILYSTGDNKFKPDPVQAHFWFSIAAKEDAAAGTRRDRIAARLTPAQLEQSNKLVAAWKPTGEGAPKK